MTNMGRACLLIASLLAPGLAFAHSPIEGIDSFYNGLLHPLFVPAHLLLILGMGLFFGQKGTRETRFALAGYFAATAIGLGLAWFAVGGNVESYLLAGAALIGLLIAFDTPVARSMSFVIATFAGLFLGMDSTQEELFGKERLLSLFGSGIGIYFLLFYPMALAEHFNKKQWHRIGVRVLGSWISASALLVLALSLSPMQG